MGYLAKWGSKGFIVSPSKIVPLTEISTGFSRKADTNNDTSGQPTTNTQGRDLQEINLSTSYIAAAGVDVRAQVDSWKEQIGKRYPLYIGGQQFGPDLLELDNVQFTITTDNNGRFLKADCSIKLVEYVPPETKVSDKKGTGGSGSGSGTKSGAMSAKPSSTEKSAKIRTQNVEMVK